MMARRAAPSLRRRLWRAIDDRSDELLSLCAAVIQVPAENPPGDTTLAAEGLCGILQSYGCAVERHEPKPGVVNLVSHLSGAQPGPRFVFNAHLDVFPADDASLWSFSPYCGEVRDGKILGRGSSDMRGGLAASLFSFLLIKELEIPITGTLTLMLVSDEETGGHWGTGWLLRTFPELRGDACMIGEPGGTAGVRIGEKGKAQLRLRAEGPAYHGGLGTGDDPVMKIAAALQEVRDVVKWKSEWPEDVRAVMAQAKAYSNSTWDRGKGWLLEHPSLTAGVIRGGIKVNIVPRSCDAEVDIRVPYGITPEQVKEAVDGQLEKAGLHEVRVEFIRPTFRASYTSPEHPLVVAAWENVRDVIGELPTLTIAFGATDARYFRGYNVPAVIYGPRPYNMAGVDEYITTEDLVRTTKVHAATAVDVLAPA